MNEYDPQRARRRPTAADTGDAAVDGILDGVADAATAPDATVDDPPPAPAVTPPPPVADPDSRMIGTAVLVALVAVAVLAWSLRRRRRRDS